MKLPNKYIHSALPDGGDAIAFVKHFHGLTFPEAVGYLLAFNGYPVDSAISLPRQKSRPPPMRERPAFVLPPPNGDNRNVCAYLRGRGIAPGVIDGFIESGLLYEDGVHHNCVFVGRDGAGKPVFAAKRGTWDSIPFRGDVAGSDKSIAFRLPCDPALDWVAVFEAPIDLMSWFTLYSKCSAVALCGLYDGPLETYLADYPHVRQRPDAKACAGYDLWKHRMNRQVRYDSKGIALLCYRDGRVFLRYVFDVAGTERRENSRDPVLWQYRDEYEGAVTAHLEECFKVPGPAGLARQLITIAVRFADEHWHDFKDRIMLSIHDSALDGLDEDNVGLRFRNAVTVSLAFLLLARCGFDLDSYFTPEDFACIGEFDTRDTVLALGNAVSESAGVILRQIERTVKACMSGRVPIPPTPAHRAENQQPPEDAPAAGDEKPAAGPACIKRTTSSAGGKKKPMAMDKIKTP